MTVTTTQEEVNHEETTKEGNGILILLVHGDRLFQSLRSVQIKNNSNRGDVEMPCKKHKGSRGGTYVMVRKKGGGTRRKYV